jgi:hypothetical protein
MLSLMHLVDASGTRATHRSFQLEGSVIVILELGRKKRQDALTQQPSMAAGTCSRIGQVLKVTPLSCGRPCQHIQVALNQPMH